MNFETVALIYILALVVLSLVLLVFFLVSEIKLTSKPSRLRRHSLNPVIAPGDEWEQAGTFNPAALLDDNGNVHLVYRAVGADGVSRLGYAFSRDGLTFEEKLPYPIYALRNLRTNPNHRPNPTVYPSGSSWGGCEDPRLIRHEGKVLLSFNAFDGWDYIRIAVTSINEKDFFSQKWNWSKPVLISPQQQIHKNWVIFPEKINGKIAILHSISPQVQIDYIDSLEELASGSYELVSRYGQRTPQDTWDAWLRGAGPPPIKTDRGWLLLYHAAPLDKSCYQLGAMLLDLNDPSIVTHKSPAPILRPEEWYEHDYKPGVVYACGAVIKNKHLFVYYGGGDKHVCVAHTPLEELLNSLQPNQ